jgi:hypothetical protein
VNKRRFTVIVKNGCLRTEVLQSKLRRVGTPQIRIEKAKQRRRLAAHTGKQQHWNVGLDAIYLRPQGSAGGIRQIVLEKNAIDPASFQQM